MSSTISTSPDQSDSRRGDPHEPRLRMLTTRKPLPGYLHAADLDPGRGVVEADPGDVPQHDLPGCWPDQWSVVSPPVFRTVEGRSCQHHRTFRCLRTGTDMNGNEPCERTGRRATVSRGTQLRPSKDSLRSRMKKSEGPETDPSDIEQLRGHGKANREAGRRMARAESHSEQPALGGTGKPTGSQRPEPRRPGRLRHAVLRRSGLPARTTSFAPTTNGRGSTSTHWWSGLGMR